MKWTSIIEALAKILPMLEKIFDYKIATVPIKEKKLEQLEPLIEKRIEKKVVKEETELQIAKKRQKRKFKRKNIEVKNDIIIDEEVEILKDQI